jgi:Holliday junction resolvase RusA-like endonuclease
MANKDNSTKTYDITPIPAPRLTQGSLWTKKAKRYAKWKDDIRKLGLTIPASPFTVRFGMPVPACGKDRLGKPHEQVPDIDNLLKALLDAGLKDDSHVHDVRAIKFWSEEGVILITKEVE